MTVSIRYCFQSLSICVDPLELKLGLGTLLNFVLFIFLFHIEIAGAQSLRNTTESFDCKTQQTKKRCTIQLLLEAALQLHIFPTSVSDQLLDISQ